MIDGSAAGTQWFLSKASILPTSSNNTNFVELQIGNIPHGQEDLVYLYGILFEVYHYP
jgi:hypothetical protein